MTTAVDSAARPRATGRDATPASVVVEGLSKHFRLPHQRYNTLKERALHPFASRTFDELRAVDDVSFEVGRGEFYGIVGRNGSGKSTLLKCLAGIYRSDVGHATVHGRLSPFIELGVGFNAELTARENVMINAIMLGLTRRQARERFDDIIAFAELENFLDLKLKNYSSGMSVRLAFSVAIQVDADVLLIDEVLAVGDAAFQQKCFDEFHRLKAGGKTIIFVTHDMGSVEQFCDRAMLMERGRVVSIGEPHDIARAYNELNFGQVPGAAVAEAADSAPTDRLAEIKDCWFEDENGERITAAAQERPITLCSEVAFHGDIENPRFAFHLRNAVRHTIFATLTEVPTGAFAAGDSAIARAHLQNWLAPGRYELTPRVTRWGTGADVLDLREDLATLLVHGTRQSGGVVDIPHSFDVERR